MKQDKLVTVIITCYNYALYLEDAVNSALKQSYKNLEIIIINDGSTDNSDEIAKRYLGKFSNIVYIAQQNSGIVKTRNLGLKKAKGEYIIQLDADDKLEDNYIEEVLSVAEKTNADIVYTNYKNFGTESGKSDFPEFNIEELKNRNYIHISSLVRTSAIKGFYFDENLNGLSHEDWEFFLNLCLNGKKAVLCRTTYLNYRIHNNARNNRSIDYKKSIEFVNVYGYIIDKHSKRLPESMNYLVGRVLCHWYADLYNKNTLQFRSKNRAIVELSDSIENTEIIKNSKSFKIGHLILHPAQLPKQFIKTIKNKISSVEENKNNSKDLINSVRQYQNVEEAILNKKLSDDTTVAVVLHLYYTDLWEYYSKKLNRLNSITFDLYVSVPVDTLQSIKNKITKDYPDAVVVETPNRGRDVLPFVKILEYINLEKYKYILKMHSKKSKHRNDGKSWLDEITDSLLPKSTKQQSELFSTLEIQNTGIVGPSNNYLSLGVNYMANRKHTMGLIADIFDDHSANLIDRQRFDFGFFAGTMFWLNTSVLKDIKNKNYQPANFELEKGQIDGTFAHSVERLFSLAPQLNGNKMYSIGENGIQEVYPNDGAIPEWSDLYKIMNDL